MSNPFFRDLHARFDASGVRAMFAPRKPRRPVLRVLLGLQKRMAKQGDMVVRSVDKMVMEVLEMSGFVDILTIE